VRQAGDKAAVPARTGTSCVALLPWVTLLPANTAEAILEGDEPDGLSLGRLYRVPVEWEDQRRLVGTG
jgi:hypothetical protein